MAQHLQALKKREEQNRPRDQPQQQVQPVLSEIANISIVEWEEMQTSMDLVTQVRDTVLNLFLYALEVWSPWDSINFILFCSVIVFPRQWLEVTLTLNIQQTAKHNFSHAHTQELETLAKEHEKALLRTDTLSTLAKSKDLKVGVGFVWAFVGLYACM